MGCNGTFDIDYRGRRGQACISQTYLWVMKSIMNFAKKIPSLPSLMTSIVCVDSFGVKNYLYLTC